MTRTIHIGCGAGFANDRPDAALRLAKDLAGRNGQRYLMLELLAERTLAEAQLRKRADPALGYAARLFDFIEPILEICLEHRIPIITNGGAANPQAAARRCAGCSAHVTSRRASPACWATTCCRLTPQR